MGTATLLQNINAVIDELALPSLTSIVGSTDNTARQLLALANREGKVASQMGSKDAMGWTALRKSSTVTIIGSQSTYTLPSDMAYPISMTFWDVTHKWRLLGPLSPQEWDILAYGISPTGPRIRFRIYGGVLNISPTPASGDAGNTLAFEYYSNAWCQSAALTAQKSFQADTDTYLLDDDSLVLGIKWRYLRAKGIDYNDEYSQWLAQISQAMGRDGGSRYLPLDAQALPDTPLLTENNVPDTGFGS